MLRALLFAAVFSVAPRASADLQVAADPPPPAAPPPNADPVAKKGEPSLNQIRGDLSGSYFRGTKLLGHGTRAPYQGGAFTLRADVRWFFMRYVGAEITGQYSFSHQSAELGGRVQAALDIAPRWSGPWGGGFIFALGGGIEAGAGSWLPDSPHGYPLLGTRLVLWPSEVSSLRLSWDFVPITTTTELRVRANRLELAFGWKPIQIGVRFGVDDATGGDPSRTYTELRGSFFVGGSIY